MQFLNEYVSKIARFFNLKEYILHEMKSYDYHVFMQILIPIAYKDFNAKSDMKCIDRD
jgi:hypothetical protein